MNRAERYDRKANISTLAAIFSLCLVCLCFWVFVFGIIYKTAFVSVGAAVASVLFAAAVIRSSETARGHKLTANSYRPLCVKERLQSPRWNNDKKQTP